MGSILGRDTSSIQVSWKSVQKLLCNPADKLTLVNKQSQGTFHLFIGHSSSPGFNAGVKCWLSYLQPAASPAPGPDCPAELHVQGGRRRFLSDLVLPPGREESHHEKCDTPESPDLKLEHKINLFIIHHASVSLTVLNQY